MLHNIPISYLFSNTNAEIKRSEFSNKAKEISIPQERWGEDRCKGGSMKKSIGFFGILFLVGFMATSAFCQNAGENKITEEEYGIYTLVMGEIGGASSVSSQTLNGLWANYLLNFFEDPIKPGPELIRNFDDKNRDTHDLLEFFVQKSKREPMGRLGEIRQITFSRVGIDPIKAQGLLVVGLTYVQPEDVMNEGKFVLLQKKDGQWTVDKIIRAWDMRLGPL